MINFPANPTDGQIVTVGRNKWKYVLATQTWDAVSAVDTSASSASTNAAAAQTARIAAEAARDAVNTTGKVFANTAAGITGTTNGQTFAVISSDQLTWIVYQNASGTAAEIARVYTKAFIDSIQDIGYRSNYVWAIVDASNRLGIAIQADGKVVFGNGGDIVARLSASEQTSASLVALSDLTYTERSGYVWGVKDASDRLAIGIDAAGNFIVKGKKISDATDANAARITSLEGINDLTISSRSGYVWGIQDQSGRISIGINPAGDFLIRGQKLADVVGQTTTLTPQVNNNTKWITPQGFWWYGDSLSASGAPGWLQTYLGKPVTVGAVGGQIAQQIAGRFGGQVSLFTVTGNQIPASGSVAVTSRTIDLITSQGGGPISGKLYGIPGTYSSDGSTFWTFTRTTPGTALTIDPNTPFLIDFTDTRQFGTVVFWYGRNNVGSTTFNADVKKALADSIASLKTVEKRFVILSVLNWPGETTGTGNYNDVYQLNAELKALYPNNFLDVLALLMRSGDGSANDISDAASGIIPRSLRAPANDGHLNNTTGNPVVSTRVYQFLQEKGWLS